MPYNPLIPLLGTYLKKPEALTPKNIRTPVYTAALFTTARITVQVSVSK